MIHVSEKTNTFHLSSGGASYVMGIVGGYLVHGYWGPALSEEVRIAQMVTLGGRPYSVAEDIVPKQAAAFHTNWYPEELLAGHGSLSTTAAPGTAAAAAAISLNDPHRIPPDNRIAVDRLPLEYPIAGSGDLRSPALTVCFSDGSRCGRLAYKGYALLSEASGAAGPQGLPYISLGDNADDSLQTLRLDLADETGGLEVSLYYRPLPDLPLILRWASITNSGDASVKLEGAASASIDLPREDTHLITLDGSWSRERHFHRRPASPGLQQIQSRGGASGHYHAPFMALAEAGTDEAHGSVRSMSLIYGGNHRHAMERSRYGSMRLQAGINPDSFVWNLAPKASFHTPAAVLNFSSAGLTGLSDAHHEFVRRHLIQPRWRGSERPIIANTWEAHYFDVNSQNVTALAKEAKAVGAELLVLDDGWFKGRTNDTRALGDWIPDEEKFPGGLAPAVKAVRETGLEFGLWVEPEMTNPDSDLFRRHPDWILKAPGRKSLLARNQLVLNLGRSDVAAYLLDVLSGLLSSAPITYVKWDMNRYMSEAADPLSAPENQGETGHRYMLGLYGLWEKLTKRFPHILFEGCAGGGGRFDFGSLAYMPQFWTSDQTDATERQKIQFGSSLLFPPETMGAHISAVPNHQVGRMTPAATRGLTAMAFNFGYELDLAAEKAEDHAIFRELSELYKTKRRLFCSGRFLRLLPVPRADAIHSVEDAPANRHAWAVISPEGAEAMVFYFQTLAEADDDGFRLRLRGLTPGLRYEDERTGAVFDAAFLESMGLWVPPAVADYRAVYWILKGID